MTTLADIPTTPWPVILSWLSGAVGVLAIVFLVLSTVNQARKLWGRRPPIDDQLYHLDKSLRGAIKQGDEHLQKQLDQIIARRAEHQSEVERSLKSITASMNDLKSELFADGHRRTQETNTEIRRLAVAIGRLDERTGGASIEV